MTTANIIENAVKAKYDVAVTDSEHKNLALKEMSNALRSHKTEILAANKLDIEAAKEHISPVMIDRLTLTEARIDAMADSLSDVVALPDPVGRILETQTRKDGLEIAKISVPLGVLAMIYESRPNVTSDAAALALKSGNACILRGGKEAINSNKAIVAALKEGLKNAQFPEDAIGLVTDTTRQSATELMTATGKIDMLIPRGGAGLIRSCVENAKVPCIETGTGICHVFVDTDADLGKAIKIIENAKTSRPSVCNAAEVLLVHESIADEFLPLVKKCLTGDRSANKVELRLCEKSAKIINGTPASPTDFDTEFLDFILAVKVVKDVDEAIKHIRAHSTGHSEAIVTESEATANKFTSFIDSAAVYVNASTRFTDGGEFGLGCEMGISTQKLHARGPMGLKELTSYKYIIKGNGHIR